MICSLNFGVSQKSIHIRRSKNTKTFEFPWSTTTLGYVQKKGRIRSKSIRFPTKKQHTYTGHFISVNSFHCKIYQRIFTSDLTSIFECIVSGNLPKSVKLVKSCILPRWKMSSLLWVQYFFGWGRKQCKNTRTTLKVLRSHLLYGAKTSGNANPELLHIMGWCVFFFRICWNYNFTATWGFQTICPTFRV